MVPKVICGIGHRLKNFDVDFFWDDNRIMIFDTQFICDFARRLIGNIKVLTIALSPKCVGGDSLQEKWKNVIDVLNIFKEELGLSISL